MPNPIVGSEHPRHRDVPYRRGAILETQVSQARFQPALSRILDAKRAIHGLELCLSIVSKRVLLGSWVSSQHIIPPKPWSTVYFVFSLMERESS